eukprot:c23472_g1_i2 orf=237-1283(+)
MVACGGFLGWRKQILVSGSLRKQFQTGGRALDLLKHQETALGGRPGSAGQKEPWSESSAVAMRRLLASPGIHRGPACYDALSAKLAEKMDFRFVFMNGCGAAASRLALPDTGLISYGEMVAQGQHLTAAVSIPVIGDGETGYGSIPNVKRTVSGYIHSGFAGIVLEDQSSPNACGHTKGRKVISREDAVLRIKAAVDAREESLGDLVIVGRTDARQSVSLDEALWRVQDFASAGADVLFIDALANKSEMQSFCKVAPGVPKMVNILEGGGITPLTSAYMLEEIGFKLVCYPLTLIGVSIRAMQIALHEIKHGRIPLSVDLPTDDVLKDILGFNEYLEEEQRYMIQMPM